MKTTIFITWSDGHTHQEVMSEEQFWNYAEKMQEERVDVVITEAITEYNLKLIG